MIKRLKTKYKTWREKHSNSVLANQVNASVNAVVIVSLSFLLVAAVSFTVVSIHDQNPWAIISSGVCDVLIAVTIKVL